MKFMEVGGKTVEVDESWLKVDRSSWKSMESHVNRWKSMDVSGSRCASRWE